MAEREDWTATAAEWVDDYCDGDHNAGEQVPALAALLARVDREAEVRALKRARGIADEVETMFLDAARIAKGEESDWNALRAIGAEVVHDRIEDAIEAHEREGRK